MKGLVKMSGRKLLLLKIGVASCVVAGYVISIIGLRTLYLTGSYFLLILAVCLIALAYVGLAMIFEQMILEYVSQRSKKQQCTSTT